MPELTPSVKIMLGIIAASTALITGMLGNVLATHINAFFSGTPPVNKPKRPVALWVTFFISAALSVLAGSFATFAPLAPATPTPQGTVVPATPTERDKPSIVVTNLRAFVAKVDTHSNFMICRDTVELANTSDIPTSVVAVGSSIHLGNTVATIQPVETSGTWSNSQYSLIVHIWRNGPPAKDYSNIRALDRFSAIRGDPLPVRVEARSTASIVIDLAVQANSSLPGSIPVTYVLRFPDIPDIKTDSVVCQ